ncbi:hypothetical protein N9D69_00140 [Flavobacteriales bacterium]|nr:hypothetical protein [Flavobacteriales bacterium]
MFFLFLEPTIVTKKPWWLIQIEIDIQFGNNIPGHECVYNSICRIRVGDNKSSNTLNFDSEEDMVKHINNFRSNNDGLLAVSENGDVLLLTSLNNSSVEFKSGFELKYAPDISKDIIRKINKYSSFRNMKTGRQYRPNVEKGKYKYLKIN